MPICAPVKSPSGLILERWCGDGVGVVWGCEEEVGEEGEEEVEEEEDEDEEDEADGEGEGQRQARPYTC